MRHRTLAAAAAACLLALPACSPGQDDFAGHGIRRVTAAEFEAMEERGGRDDILNATVRIEKDGKGSGTFVTPRRILTNHHVAGESGEATIRGWIKAGGKTYPVTYQAKVIAHDKARDLALLEMDEDWPGFVASLAGEVVYSGDRVLAAGSPLGKMPHIVSGEVSLPLDDQPLEGLRHTMATAPVAPGNSGGGLWRKNPATRQYEMVGVTRALALIPVGFGAAMLPHMSYFIPLAEVRAFLTSNGVGA
jgi:S1-C subfamily serine protease